MKLINATPMKLPHKATSQGKLHRARIYLQLRLTIRESHFYGPDGILRFAQNDGVRCEKWEGKPPLKEIKIITKSSLREELPPVQDRGLNTGMTESIETKVFRRFDIRFFASFQDRDSVFLIN